MKRASFLVLLFVGVVASPVDELSCQGGWTASMPSPCIALGDLAPFATWNDPCVVKDGGRFVMFLTRSAAPGKTPVRPFRATSTDGLAWTLDPPTPLLEPGPPGAFDAMSVETPSVVRFGGLWHLYYTAVKSGLGGPLAIGHAVSADGIHWEKSARNPSLAPSPIDGTFDAMHVAEPAALVREGQVYLYFTAVEAKADRFPPARRVIALAKSADGAAFSPPKIVLRQGAAYPPSSGFDGYSTPAAAVVSGRVHLFYDIGYFDPAAERKWTQVALHHASSPDGEGAWVEDAKPIFTRRSFPWTAMEIRSPAPIVDDQTLYLYFAGNDFPAAFIPEVRLAGRTERFGIGRAALPIQNLGR